MRVLFASTLRKLVTPASQFAPAASVSAAQGVLLPLGPGRAMGSGEDDGESDYDAEQPPFDTPDVTLLNGDDYGFAADAHRTVGNALVLTLSKSREILGQYDDGDDEEAREGQLEFGLLQLQLQQGGGDRGGGFGAGFNGAAFRPLDAIIEKDGDGDGDGDETEIMENPMAKMNRRRPSARASRRRSTLKGGERKSDEASKAVTPEGGDLEGVGTIALRDDPKYAKYFKMLAMHVPRGAVEQKMRSDGVDVAVLDMDPEAALLGSGGGQEKPKGVPLKDDPKYAKYFKMLAMHLPRGAVEQKMRSDGVDVTILDRGDDDSGDSSQTAAASSLHKAEKRLTLSGRAEAAAASAKRAAPPPPTPLAVVERPRLDLGPKPTATMKRLFLDVAKLP